MSTLAEIFAGWHEVPSDAVIPVGTTYLRLFEDGRLDTGTSSPYNMLPKHRFEWVRYFTAHLIRSPRDEERDRLAAELKHTLCSAVPMFDWAWPELSDLARDALRDAADFVLENYTRKAS